MNAITHWFDDPRSIRLGLSLVHFLWQGTVLGMAASVLMIWMKRASSRRRYGVLLALLLAMAVAPAVTFLVVTAPRRITESPNKTAAADAAPRAAETILTSRVTAMPMQPIAPATFDRPPDDTGTGNALIAPSDATRPSRLSSAWTWIGGHLSWMVAFWALGVVLFSVRLMIGVRGASRVRRKGVAPASDACRVLGAELAARLGLRRMATICESTVVQVPVVVGWLKPVVLLPVSIIAEMPESELRAILAHELAHIRRHDYLVNMGQTIIETLLFYHPMVWWLSSAIRREREQCCDDLAVEACGDKVVVAKALVRLAEVRALPAQAALAATGGRLSQRIRRLLATPDAKSPSWWGAAAGSFQSILLISVAVVAVGLFTCALPDRQAVAQESNPEPDGTQKANHQIRVDAAPESKVEHPATGLPVLSELPYLSKIFTIPAKSEAAKKEIEQLQGVWQCTSDINSGVASKDQLSGMAIVGDCLISGPILLYDLDVSQNPKAIDLYETRDGKRVVIRDIYELNEDRLTIATTGGERRPKSFDSTAENRVNRMVFKRISELSADALKSAAGSDALTAAARRVKAGSSAAPASTGAGGHALSDVDSSKLLTSRISLDFSKVPLRTALDQLTQMTSLSIVLDQSALKGLNITEQEPVTVVLKDVAVADALRLILHSVNPRLEFKVADNCIFVTDSGEAPKSGSLGTTKSTGDSDELQRQLRLLEERNEEERRELERLEKRLIDKPAAPAGNETPERFTEKALGGLPGHQHLGSAYKGRSCTDCHGDSNSLERITERNLRQIRQIQLRNQEQADLAKLEGAWKVANLKLDGKDTTQHGSPNQWVFRGRQVIVIFGSEVPGELSADDPRWSTLFINPMKSEKEMTVVGKNMLIQAIYRLDGNTLTVSYFGRSEADRPTSFTSKKDDLLPHLVFTLHRVENDAKRSY